MWWFTVNEQITTENTNQIENVEGVFRPKENFVLLDR